MISSSFSSTGDRLYIQGLFLADVILTEIQISSPSNSLPCCAVDERAEALLYLNVPLLPGL